MVDPCASSGWIFGNELQIQLKLIEADKKQGRITPSILNAQELDGDTALHCSIDDRQGDARSCCQRNPGELLKNMKPERTQYAPHRLHNERTAYQICIPDAWYLFGLLGR